MKVSVIILLFTFLLGFFSEISWISDFEAISKYPDIYIYCVSLCSLKIPQYYFRTISLQSRLKRKFDRIKTSTSADCLVCVRPFGSVCIRTVGVLWPWNGCIIELYMAEPDQRRFTGWARLHALTLHATTVPQGSLPCAAPTIFLPPSAAGQERNRGKKNCWLHSDRFLQP